MSYSFNVRAGTLAAALTLAALKFDEIVSTQPVHAKDKDLALANADALGKVLGPQPENVDITISMNGSLSWTGDDKGVDTEFRGAAATAYVGYIARPPVDPVES